MRQKMLKRKKGFTLIELVIVIGVLGVLASLIIPSTNESLRQGRRAATTAAVNSLVIGIGQYYFETGSMPASLDSLTQKQDQFGPWATTQALTDEWNSKFNYSYDDNDRIFAVWSSGPDRANNSGGGVPSKFTGDDIGTISQY